jgi:hypothetical protein
MNPFELRDNSTKVVLIVVGSVVGVLLLLLLACAGVGFIYIHKAGQALQAMAPQLQAQGELVMADGAAQEFFNDLGGGLVEQAYGNTTAGFRARQTLPQFKKFVEGHPLLTKLANAQHDPVNNPPGAQQLTFPYTLPGEGGPQRVTVQVVKQGDDWKVDAVTVP